MTSKVAAFISRRWRVPERSFQLELEPMRGGLEATVARARISSPHEPSSIPSQLVIKQLPVGGEREADVYRALWRHLPQPPAARLLGRDDREGRTYLYLEHVTSPFTWPWSETALAGAVCRELAQFHETETLPHAAFAWDYETELARSAEATLELAKVARHESGSRWWRRLGDLRRVVSALPRVRARLFTGPATVIHGDMHSGNVILRDASPEPDVVLIDWGRARVGSPLEDVASWLHSLGCWEPEARRRHDTLMRAYLDARSVPEPFSRELREDYWLASASNGLSGAIYYHLAVLSDPDTSDAARHDSRHALMSWERIIRRAAAILSTSPDR